MRYVYRALNGAARDIARAIGAKGARRILVVVHGSELSFRRQWTPRPSRACSPEYRSSPP
jgi:hypothetical protein